MAVSCWIAFWLIVTVGGCTVTLAIEALLILTVAEPEMPPMIAVIVEVPSEIPVTVPSVDTVATLVLELNHCTGRPDERVPRGVARDGGEFRCFPWEQRLQAGRDRDARHGRQRHGDRRCVALSLGGRRDGRGSGCNRRDGARRVDGGDGCVAGCPDERPAGQLKSRAVVRDGAEGRACADERIDVQWQHDDAGHRCPLHCDRRDPRLPVDACRDLGLADRERRHHPRGRDVGDSGVPDRPDHGGAAHRFSVGIVDDCLHRLLLADEQRHGARRHRHRRDDVGGQLVGRAATRPRGQRAGRQHGGAEESI